MGFRLIVFGALLLTATTADARPWRDGLPRGPVSTTEEPTTAAVTTVSFQNASGPGGYHGIEDNWVWSAYPENNKGGHPDVWIGSWHGFGPGSGLLMRQLMRVDLSALRGRYTRIAGMRLKMTMKSVDTAGGAFTNQPFELYRVSNANKGWRPGISQDAPQDGGSCWNHLAWSSFDPTRSVPWAGSPGLGTPGVDRASTPAAIAYVSSSSAAGTLITWEFTDLSFVETWINQPEDNPGFIIIAPGLEAHYANSVRFHASEATDTVHRPLLEVDVEGYQAPVTGVINYTLDAPGRVSLVVYDTDGKVIRELRHAEPQTAGAHSVTWDGLDELGRPVPGGTYTWKLLRTPNALTAEHLMDLGVGGQPGNIRFLPWQWVGNHQGPKGIAVDSSGVYVSGGMGEGASLLIKMTPTGELQWIHHDWVEAWHGGQSIGVDGDTVFLLQQNGRIARFDAATGAFSGDFFEAVYDELDRMNSTPDFFPDNDLAAGGGRLVVSYSTHDAFRWIDPVDGSTLSEVPVPDIRGIALDALGNAFVISGARVLMFPPLGSTPTVIIPSGLEAAYRLSVDPSTGDLLVADGAPSHQVRRFTSDGTWIADYGTPGGRHLEGLYDNTGFHDLKNIAVAPDGSFWVTEPYVAPRRTVHLSADGQLVHEFFGGTQYFAFGAADPDNPNMVWMDCADSQVMQVEVDHVARTWSLRATYDTRSINPLFTGPPAHEKWLIRRHNGNTYLVRSKTPGAMLVDEANRRLLPLSLGSRTSQLPPELQPSDSTLYSYFWTDGNGDGLMSANELSFNHYVLGDLNVTGLNSWVGDDFSYVGGFFSEYDHSSGPTRLVPRGFNAVGAPIYDWADLELNPTDGAPLVPEAQGLQSAYAAGFWKDGDGSTYGVFIDRSYTHGVGVWSSRIGNAKVVKWDATGRRQWAVGRHAPFALPAPGELQYPWRIAGMTHGTVIVTDVEHGSFHVYDSDGLYVGRILDQHTGNAPADAYRACENFGGSVSTLSTGEVFFYGNTCNSVPVYRVTGWDGWTRLGGSVPMGLDVPGPPTGLSATPSDGTATLRWTGVAGADRYHVKRATTPGGPYTTAATVEGATATSHVDSGLVNGTRYHYVVTAENSYGESAPSVETSVVPRPVGLTAEYFSNQNKTFNGTPTLTRVDPTVDFRWSENPPDPSISADHFTVRWRGQIQPSRTESYTIHTFADDGVRLWVDGQLLVDTWQTGTPYESYGQITMVAGARYDITLEYFESLGSAEMRLMWSGLNTPQEPIPSSALYPLSQTTPPPTPTGLQAFAGDGIVMLDWSEAPGAATYNLLRAEGDGAFSLLSGGLTMTAYADGGVVNNTRYRYAVTAVNLGGESAPSSPVTATPRVGGLTGQYFANQMGTFDGTPTLTRVDSTVDFQWGLGSPDPIIPPDVFTVRWSGQVEATFSETYTFHTLTDDGARLWVNGALLVDRWVDQGQTEWSGSIPLAAGQRYDIVLEYYENGGGAAARLSWSSPSTTKQVIPSSQLYAASSEPEPEPSPSPSLNPQPTSLPPPAKAAKST